MRVAVFGAGGVGGYFGGRLAQAKEDVIFIARGDHLQSMLSRGLRVDSTKGDFWVNPVQATDDPAQVGTADVVLVAVKAWQVPNAAESMRPMLGPETMVLPLQNGLEAPGQLAAVLGGQHVLGGLCGLSTFIVGPGHIRHTAIDPFVRLGELDNRLSDRVKRLQQVFIKAEVTAEIPSDIHLAMWLKFLFITPFSGVGAITRSPLGVWRGLPETRRMAKETLQEIVAVGRARGVAFSEDVLSQTMKTFDSLPPDVTASMQRDIMEGRPSELDAQVGVVVRFGKEEGVPTPLHSFIYNCLLPMELQARGQLSFSDEP
ncbi:MAG: 2-dehydropantoate 2-reductase [Desulfobacterales bacterium]|jgi:2-dehydropantoate 2-reductase